MVAVSSEKFLYSELYGTIDNRHGPVCEDGRVEMFTVDPQLRVHAC